MIKMKMISTTFVFNLIFLVPLIRSTNFKCVKDGFFPDQKDCWLYHICVGNMHTVKACKEDLLFNPVKNECDWAMNVNCSRTSPDDVLPSTQNFSIPGEKHIVSAIPSSASIFEQLCQSVENDYIAHPTECKRYAYCANGVPQPKMCSKSLLWSQSEKMCVWPAQSDCPAKSISTTTTIPAPFPSWHRSVVSTFPSSYMLTDAPPPLPSAHVYRPSILCPPDQSWRVPDPHDCSIYHDCHHGHDLVSYCPAQLQYNREKQTCDHAVNVQCENKCTEQNDRAKFVDLNSCCHYYQCFNGKFTRQTCSYPQMFDVQTRTCLSYKLVKCDGRRPCLSKCHYLANYEMGKTLCESVPSCVGHGDGFYLDRTKPHCQAFIQCLDNRLVNQSRCNHGQRFNRNTGRCAPADQVPCQALQQVEQRSLILFLLLSLLMY